VIGRPCSITAHDDEVYVSGITVCESKWYVQVYNQEGEVQRSWTRKGKRHERCYTSVAVSSSGTVFIADYSHKSVHVFDQNGVFLHKWGRREGQRMSNIEGIAVSRSSAGGGGHEVYLSQRGRIQVYSCRGIHLRTLDVDTARWDTDEETGCNYVSRVAISNSGDLYLIDTSTLRIQVLDKFGSLIRHITGFDDPSGVAFSSAGDGYVIDNTGIKVFNAEE
jgi:hypothetical protein